MLDLKNKNILVTGAAGFLGSHLVEKLLRGPAHRSLGEGGRGVPKEKIFTPSFEEFDLRDRKNCEEVVRGIDVVIHLAAKVGGIGYNQEKPAELFYDNIMMGVELMEAARKAGAQKFVGIGTI